MQKSEKSYNKRNLEINFKNMNNDKNITSQKEDKKNQEIKNNYLKNQLNDKSNYDAFKRLTEK